MKMIKIEKRKISKQQHSRNVQYLWTLIVLLSVLFCTFIMISITASAKTEGYISGTVISSYEYDAQEGLYPDGIVVGEDATYVYYAIVSTGDSGTEGDGYVRTVKVTKTTGAYTASLIDYLEFDTSDCYFPSICSVGTGYYAICYTDAGSSKQTIVTVSIDSVGSVGNAVTDTQQMSYDGFDGTGSCQIMQMSGTTYVICYTVSDADGWLETYTISTSGAITNAVIDTQEFDTADGRFPRMCLVDSDTIAIVYGGVDTGAGVAFDGWLCTYNITSGGTITNTPADTFEFDSAQGTQPDILKYTSTTYVIAYEGTDADGFVIGVTINSDGKITKVPIFTTEHDTADSGYNRLFNVGTPIGTGVNNIYALTYQGVSGDGYIKTFIDGTQRDFLEFDTADDLNYAPIFFINYTFWGICYAGTGNDGFIITVGIDNEYDLTLYNTYTNTKGTHQYNIQDTYYNVWANATTTMMLRENVVNSSVVHQSLWNSTTGNMMVWANVTGPSLIFVKYAPQDSNYTVAKSYNIGLNRYAVTMTDTINLKLVNNIVNATGTHVKGNFVVSKSSLDSNGFGDYWGNTTVWANYTGTTTPLAHLENIINATGSFTHVLRSDGYHVWSNYTGTTTPIHRYANIINAIGTHDYLLNSTGYWDWANYTSNINQVENIVDATGTHEYNFDTVTGTWNDWANYTGTTTPLTLFENVLYSAGTHEYNLGVGGYNVWANYSTSLTTYEDIVDASGTHDSNWDGTGWNVWANYTGDPCGSTDLNIITDIVNATGENESSYSSDDGWTVWVNYTGNTTPIHRFENIVNAVGTHDYLLNSTGYWDWANYTGTGGSGTTYKINLSLNGVIGFINWSGFVNSSSVNISFNATGNATLVATADANTSEGFLFIAGFDITEPFLLLSILFALFYFWWKAESMGIMYLMTMLLIPYIIVVGVVYLLPLYITDASILLFVRLIFLMLSVGIGGFTIDRRAKSRKVGYERKS
jgi:hypothetical protein